MEKIDLSAEIITLNCAIARLQDLRRDLRHRLDGKAVGEIDKALDALIDVEAAIRLYWVLGDVA